MFGVGWRGCRGHEDGGFLVGHHFCWFVIFLHIIWDETRGEKAFKTMRISRNSNDSDMLYSYSYEYSYLLQINFAEKANPYPAFGLKRSRERRDTFCEPHQPHCGHLHMFVKAVSYSTVQVTYRQDYEYFQDICYQMHP